MNEWRKVKPLANESLIYEAEAKLGISFTESYISFVKKYNGARPPVRVFDTDKTKECTIKTFLSLNQDDLESMMNANKNISDIANGVVAFAVDSFGNYICFKKTDNSIVFLDHETGSIEHIADSFDDFFAIVDGKISGVKQSSATHNNLPDNATFVAEGTTGKYTST